VVLTARLQRCQEKSLAPARTCNRDSLVIHSITYSLYGLTNSGFPNIRTEIGMEGRDWIWLAEDRVQGRAVVKGGRTSGFHKIRKNSWTTKQLQQSKKNSAPWI